MAPISLKTKLVLAISGMVFALVAAFSFIYVAKVVGQRTNQAYQTAALFAKEILERAGDVTYVDPAILGVDINDAVAVDQAMKERLHHDPGLLSLFKSIVGFSDVVQDAAIVDDNKNAIVDTNQDPLGTPLEPRESFDAVFTASLYKQLQVLYGPPRVYDYHVPIKREGKPFGEIRVGISTVLFKHEIQPQLIRALGISCLAILVSLVLAASLSNIALRPLEEISRRLDQMTAGTPDAVPEPEPRRTDEYGVVNIKIDRLGRQMRDVKEVFTAMKENLDQLMESLQDGLILFTRDSRVVLVSSSAERFVGRPRTEILGHTVEDIFKLDGKLGSVVLDAFTLHQSVPQREVELENGQRVQVALDFISERGERIGALLTIRDAESVRRIESEIELSHRLASIGRLTSGVAHEVKNPINAIVVHLELLREKMREVPTDTRRHMDIISNEIHRLDRVVQTLIDFNRPVELRLKTIDLRRILEEVTQLAAPEAEQNGVNIVTQFGSEPLPVLIDYDLVKQALDNVVLNGVQAMADGGTLRITARRDDKAATVEVSDSGPGIPQDIRDKIFNLYFTTKKTGSGIGLAMTYRVLQMHHGSLDFETELGRGTTFRLCLPLTALGQNSGTVMAAAGEPSDRTNARSEI